MTFAAPTTASQRTDALIIGGGMVGLTLSLGLARAGLTVRVVEHTPYSTQLESTFDGRVSAIALGSKRLLAHLGAWEGMAPNAQPILDIAVSDGDSPFFLHYDHQDVGTEPFGWIVENRHIRHALVQALADEPRINVASPLSLASYEADEAGVTAHMKNGEIFRASLLIAADGKNSAIRGMAGIGSFAAHYDQTAIVCTIAHSLLHNGIAEERFLPAGPFAMLPMQGNRTSLVWVEPRDTADYFLTLSESDIVQEIRERVGPHLGQISLEGPCFAYPLSFSHAKSYVAPRMALVGDAAHAIHPIAGQGVNLGFRDVAVLTELLTERVRLGMDIGAGDVLAHYQRWRRFDSVAMLGVTDGLNRLFSNALPPLVAARGFGLRAVSQLPPLKRFLMRHAMGLTGDVPALMQDKAA